MNTRTALLLLMVALTALPPMANAAEQDWRFIKFAEVRAYRMNWDKEDALNSILRDGGGLNETRLPKEGVPLNDKQIAALKAAVTGPQKNTGVGVGCFHPHHAFVFYNDRGAVMGHIDVCFLCGGCQMEPMGFSERCNLSAVEELIRELGMPLSNPAWPSSASK